MQQILEPNPPPKNNHDDIVDEFDKNLVLSEDLIEEEDEDEDDDDDDDSDGDFEFSFASNVLTSPVAAEEVFQNGQIRPLFPSSDDLVGNSEEATTSYGPPVKKLFVVSSDPENDDVAEGPYCSWSPDRSPTPVAAPEMSRKSNSTGLSKLWKVKELLIRSHSDGKDAFVFLTGKSEDESKMKQKTVNLPAIKVGKGETTSADEKKGKKKKKSAYEALYGKKEKTAGKSYLPYRQDLVGFFTNSNAMSRNVYPY